MSEATMQERGDNEKNVEMWKMKKLIKSLSQASGNGTSMISLLIPPKENVSRIQKMLTEESGTAVNIKSRVNRQSVIAAIASVQARLRLFPKIPANGLAIFCGTITTDENKEKLVNIHLEPIRPIVYSKYLCDNRFHTEDLEKIMIEDNSFGFIVVDGSCCLFGMVQGDSRQVLHKFTVDLPKKHGRGGQSALRFARLRMEKRHNYIRKVAELAVELFIEADKVKVAGIVLAGSADLKTELAMSDLFDQRLQAKVIKMVDIAYGGENGFNQAIELAASCLSSVRLIEEKILISSFFEQISQDNGKYVFGVKDTLQALETGAVETLICWETLDIVRYKLRDENGVEKIIHASPKKDIQDQLIDELIGQRMEVLESGSFLEWIVENYKNFGCALEIVSNKSPEGCQFERGFGGLGGILRYRIDLIGDLIDDLDDIDLDEY